MRRSRQSPVSKKATACRSNTEVSEDADLSAIGPTPRNRIDVETIKRVRQTRLNCCCIQLFYRNCLWSVYFWLGMFNGLDTFNYQQPAHWSILILSLMAQNWLQGQREREKRVKCYSFTALIKSSWRRDFQPHRKLWQHFSQHHFLWLYAESIILKIYAPVISSHTLNDSWLSSDLHHIQ